MRSTYNTIILKSDYCSTTSSFHQYNPVEYPTISKLPLPITLNSVYTKHLYQGIRITCTPFHHKLNIVPRVTSLKLKMIYYSKGLA